MITRNESRLPKWAQNELQRLRADNDRLGRKIETMMGTSDAASDTFVVSPADGRWSELPLPRGQRVRFKVGDQYLDVRVHDDQVELMAQRTLRIEPRACNVVWIGLEGF